jgi:hypothetical protein
VAGGEHGFLNQARDDRVTRKSDRLQAADLAHTRCERGVHRIEPAEQPAGRDEDRRRPDHELDRAEEGAQRRVVGRLAHRDQLEVEPLPRKRVDVVQALRRIHRDDDA